MKPWSKHPVPYPVAWLEPGRESQGLEGDEEGKLLGGAVRLSGFGNEGDWLGLSSCPVRFEGDKGWVEVGDHGKIVTSDPALLVVGTPAKMAGTDPSKNVRNFLDCVKSRAKPACKSTVARYGHIACHAAAIAWKLGRKMKFDPATEAFIGDPEADAMRTRPRRAPWNA